MTIIDRLNWEDYKGWSDFEIEQVLPFYLKMISWRGLNEKIIYSTGCGNGFPDHLLLKEGAVLYGIDNNEQLLIQAERKGLQTRLQDMCNVYQDPSLESVADIVVAPFLASNIPEEEFDNLFKSFYHLLKTKGILIVLDPNAKTEHIRSNDPHTFRTISDLDGNEILDFTGIDSDVDDYLVKIHLNYGLKNETIIINRHKKFEDYVMAFYQNGFLPIGFYKIGWQRSIDDERFPAYQIWAAVRH